ncbi:cilia- and flagella-associated protein 99-like [Acanthaster planci]|uniref:Cilia- and flagella-associated protein 99-like n=1 Tax=Acanthaster planci TaxID=133434 RepID=A0A8B7YYB3_ACAPL|nr:cilia- and flagella-associated protein 99-like [Acanthaster planci]
MNHASLLHHCVAILDSYDPDAFGVEQHLKTYLSENKSVNDEEQVFLTEVFSGCVRHTHIMGVVIDGFYIKAGKSCLRTDINLYTVLCYLALFRLDELEMVNFRKFVRSQDVNKMHRFLAFFLDESNLKTWIKDEWCKIYEHSYVQVQLVSPILRWLPELTELVNQLADKIANKVKTQRKVKTPTDVKPFNITQPRPRSVPMPEKIPLVHKHKPVPKTTYSGPREEKLILEAKERNRRRAEEQLYSAAKNQFACANAEKSEKTQRRLNKILAQEESKLQFDKQKTKEMPAAITDNIPIKLNAATILREGALYQKREEEEMKKLELLEAGAKDASQFLEWQQEMRQRDMEEQLADIERRRLEGKLSHEEAILARQSLIKDNREKVLEMKKEAEQMMQEYVARQLEEEKVLKQMVEDVISGHKNAKEAKSRIQESKRKIVEEVSEESRDLLQQAFEQAEAEMKRKMELIQQIRAMEATPKNRTKLIDWTATAGHSLLSEMSIAELKERLALLATEQQEKLESKRDEILESKEAKDRLLMEKLQQISKHRAAEGQLSAVRQEKKKATKNQRPEIKDPKISDLQEKLERRKEERLRANKEMKISPSKQSTARIQSLNKQKMMTEEKRWKELEQRKERQAALQSKGIMTDVAGQKLNSFSRSRQLAATAALS